MRRATADLMTLAPLRDSVRRLRFHLCNNAFTKLEGCLSRLSHGRRRGI